LADYRLTRNDKETGKPGEFDGLTTADKRERITGIARELGLDRVRMDERLALSAPSPMSRATDRPIQPTPRIPAMVDRPIRGGTSPAY
jgi:hypothetical protein